MKKRKNSWLAYCLVGIMAIGLISALVGCDPESGTNSGTTDTTEYTVTITATPNGTVTANPMRATSGTRIDVTVTSDEGYQLRAGSLRRGNSASSMNTTITNNRFNMPGNNVWITAVFEEPPPVGPVKPDYEQYRAELESIIAGMTLAEKVGQMTQAERGQLDYGPTHPYADQVKNYFLGSVLSGGESGPGSGDVPASGNNGDTSIIAWWRFNDRMLRASMENEPRGAMANKINPITGEPGYGIPFVYGIDAVHGHANAIQYPTVFPHNIGMGAIAVGDLDKGKKAAHDVGVVTAAEMYSTGHRFNFNPVLGVGENSSWGRMYESFSENPDIAAAMGSYYVWGLQESGKVGACGKHYGFEGQVSINADSDVSNGNAAVGNVRSDENLHKISPYKAAIDAGLLSVMTYYGSVNGTPPVRYKELIDVLKVDWGFAGFVITDWSNMGTGTTNIGNSINAGVDMNMAASANEWRNYITNLTTLVNNNTVPMSRIDDAVYRILLFKKVFGILDDPLVPEPQEPYVNGSPEHRQVSRDVAAQTLVLLKNTDDIVGKLKDKQNILLTGTGSNSLGIQCGGWTRAWQGFTTTPVNFSGTTISAGIQNALPSSVNFQQSNTGSVTGGFTPDVIIAVVSETPYSEGSGDNRAPGISAAKNAVSADVTMLNTIYTSFPDVPKVLVVISGRPISLSTTTGTAPNQVTVNWAERCEGIVAAWLPGSEAGDAIADVFFGDKDFVGKTSFTWRTAPTSVTTPPPVVVFPYGWGLKKGETGTPDLSGL